MRLAFISDIHGNSLALDAVLADIQAQGGVDGYLVLGDLAALGPDPIGVLERLANLPGATIIRGNTDRYVVTGDRPYPSLDETMSQPSLVGRFGEVQASFAWTAGAVAAAGWRDWLSKLPLEARIDLPDGRQLLGVHASPGEDDGFGFHPATPWQQMSGSLEECGADLVAVGHFHYPFEAHFNGIHLVNTGGVSNPLPPNLGAKYGILEADTTGHRVSLNVVDYDRELVIRQLEQVGHPARNFIIRHLRGQIFPQWHKDIVEDQG